MKPMKIILPFLMIFLLFGCEEAVRSVTNIQNPEPLSISQFDPLEGTLEDSIKVDFENGETVSVNVEWNRTLESVDTTVPGEAIIEGTIYGEFQNPENIKARQVIQINPVSITSGLEKSGNTTMFATLYEGFEHEAKASVETLFVPSDTAIESLLGFLDMDLETFMNDFLFEPIMLDHMIGEDISTNRLEMNVPGLYDTLGDTRIIIEGDKGSPLIDDAHKLIGSYKLNESHMHIIDGVIITDESIGNVGQDFLDDVISEEVMTVLRDEGLLTDIFAGERLTLFIPSETAMNAYASQQGMTLQELVQSETFDALLLSHIVRGEHPSDELYANAPLTLTSVNDASIDITVVSQEMFANNAKVTGSQFNDQLGIIFTIDEVLTSSNG